MLKNKKLILSIVFFGIIGIFITGCNRESKVVSYNLSRDADSFKIKRRVVFFNGITDKYLMEIIGYCSIGKDNVDNQLEVTCKVGPNEYKKHYFGLSDNTAYFVEQIDAKTESQFNYKVVFRPQTIIPDVNIQVSKRIAPAPKIEVKSEK